MSNMDCDKIQGLLVGLREGTISQEEREIVERHTAACPQCTADLTLIDEALEALRNVADDTVPNHYFTNLLPRVRARIEQDSRKRIPIAFPAWLQRFLAPASAGAVLASMIGMYFLFSPMADTQFALREIVSDLPKDEIEGVAESVTSAGVLARATEPSQRLEETLANPTAVTRRIERELVDDQLNHGHSLSIFLAAENPFEDIIENDDVDSIIKKLNDTSL
ncbi:MAG TPA: zf-HC2 domain-containing protein [Bacteroidota bacterium]|nr:zf-HC2 domain-containing protein [Bacteroidota bacterium]